VSTVSAEVGGDGRAAPGGPVRLFADRILRAGPAGLLLALSAMVVGAVAANYPALLSGRVIDQVIARDVSSFYGALPFLFALLGCFAAREGAALIRKMAIERAVCALERDELQRLSSSLLRLDLSAFWGQRIGGLNLRIHRSIEGLVRLLKLLFMDLAPTLLQSTVALVIVASRSTLVLGAMAAMFLCALTVTIIQMRTQSGIRLALFRAKEDVSANLTEVLFGLDYVRAAGGTAQEEARTAGLAKRVYGQELRHHRWMMGFDSAKQMIEGLGLVLVIGIGAWKMAHGAMSGGDVLTLSLLYGSAAAPLRDLHRILDEGVENMMKVVELADLYALPSDPGIPGVQRLPPPGKQTPVAAADLYLTIPGDAGADELLCGLSFHIAPGEWVGVAGASGCGKSTLLKAILGMAPGYRGELLVFGVDVQSCLKTDLWDRLGYVGQAPHLVKGTLRDNLLYGIADGSVTDEALVAALVKAGLRERFPGASEVCLMTPIEELGRNLSGGERQRLSIARLFLRNPVLLILDEATSMLDLENEWRVIQAVRDHFRGIPAIVVAHRLEALRQTDRILVMRRGRIVEQGDFYALQALGGEFNRIANLPQLEHGS